MALPRMTPEQVERAIAMRDKGYSWAIIAQRFGLTERSVRRHISAHLKAREDGKE